MLNEPKSSHNGEDLVQNINFQDRSRLFFPYIQTKQVSFIKICKMHRRAQIRKSQDNSLNAKEGSNAIKGFLPRKCGKAISKADKPKKINTLEWTIFEKCTYARLLMQFIMHSLQINDYFFYLCADKIGRTSHQIFAFHAKMTALHRHAQAIVVQLLGCKLPTFSNQMREREDQIKSDNSAEDSINLKQVYLDSNQWSLDSAEVHFLSNLIISDACPDTEDLNEQSEVFEMSDYECQKSLELTAESSLMDQNAPYSNFSCQGSGNYLSYCDYY